MGSHEFTSGPPDNQFTIDLSPPQGAAALVIQAVFHRPQASSSDGDVTYRLLHLRRKGIARLPFAEICELLYNAKTGVYTVAFSGFGQKKAHSQPQHLGKVAGPDIPVKITVPLPGAPTMTASIAVGPSSGSAVPDLAVMQKQDNSGPVWGKDDVLELVSGFEGPGDLKPPAGWTMTWAEDGSAIQWPGAKAMSPAPGPVPTEPPVLPPPVLPKPPEPEPRPDPGPPISPMVPTPDLKAQLKADLLALAIKYGTAEAQAAGIDPLWVFFIEALIARVKV